MILKTIIRWCRYLNYVAAFGVFLILGGFMRELWKNMSNTEAEEDGLSFSFTSIIFSLIRWFILPVLSLLGMETLKIIIFRWLPNYFLKVSAEVSYRFITMYAADFISPNDDLPVQVSIFYMAVHSISIISLLKEDPMGTIEVVAACIFGIIIHSIGEFQFLGENIGVALKRNPWFLMATIYSHIRSIRRGLEPKCRFLYDWANTEHGFFHYSELRREIAPAEHRHLE